MVAAVDDVAGEAEHDVRVFQRVDLPLELVLRPRVVGIEQRYQRLRRVPDPAVAGRTRATVRRVHEVDL